MNCPNCGKKWERVRIPTGIIEMKCRGCGKYVLVEFPTAQAIPVSPNWWGGTNSVPVPGNNLVIDSVIMGGTEMRPKESQLSPSGG